MALAWVLTLPARKVILGLLASLLGCSGPIGTRRNFRSDTMVDQKPIALDQEATMKAQDVMVVLPLKSGPT
jgi:hypothetical protein